MNKDLKEALSNIVEPVQKAPTGTAPAKTEVTKERFVDFNKLLVTDDKQELVDILKKDVRDDK